VEAQTGSGTQNKEQFRKVLGATLEHNLFYMPSFKIYGGVAGLYDYGPTGAAIKANLQHFWRQHFVLEDNMLEVGWFFCAALARAAVRRHAVRVYARSAEAAAAWPTDRVSQCHTVPGAQGVRPRGSLHRPDG
jgi:hypothetical protein